MVGGLSKYDGKEKRRQRRNYQRNHIKADLRTPKYKEQTFKDRKRIETAEGFYLDSRDYDNDEQDFE